jgi:hypothetical protein
VQPSEKFVKLSKKFSELHDWKLELETRLAELGSAESRTVRAVARRMRSSQNRKDMSEATMPRTVE